MRYFKLSLYNKLIENYFIYLFHIHINKYFIKIKVVTVFNSKKIKLFSVVSLEINVFSLAKIHFLFLQS